jgi:Domain of unknown function (DUF1707)
MALRASDADRERIVELLRAQQAVGRLTVEELEERSAAALAAVHVEDLAPLVADLPVATRTAEPSPPPRRLPRIPGRISFSGRWSARVRPDEAMADLMIHVAPALTAYGYDVVERGRTRVVFERRTTPLWVVIPCVFLFPIGLVALLARHQERIAIDLVERGGETVMVAQGVAPLSVRKAFAELEF